MLERHRPPTRSTRGTVVRVALAVAVLVFAFLLGIAVAQTLEERPEPGDLVTNVRTLTPLPQQPPRTVTVTETVTTGD